MARMTIEEMRAKRAEYARKWRARQQRPLKKRIRIYKPKPPRPPRPPRPKQSLEERRVKRAAYARLWRARQVRPLKRRIRIQRPETPRHLLTPEEREKARAMTRLYGRRWLAKMEATDPVRYAEYKKRQTEKEMARRRTNPQRRFAVALRTKVWVAIRRQQAGKKTENTVALTGCTILGVMAHLEKQFEPGMTWRTFGKGYGKWSVDHIRPLASWDLTDPAQQREAFHWSNLAPKWYMDNMAKGSLWNGRRWLHAGSRHTDHACVPAPEG